MNENGERSLAGTMPSLHLCAISRYLHASSRLPAQLDVNSIMQALVSGLHSEDDRGMIHILLTIGWILKQTHPSL